MQPASSEGAHPHMLWSCTSPCPAQNGSYPLAGPCTGPSALRHARRRRPKAPTSSETRQSKPTSMLCVLLLLHHRYAKGPRRAAPQTMFQKECSPYPAALAHRCFEELLASCMRVRSDEKAQIAAIPSMGWWRVEDSLARLVAPLSCRRCRSVSMHRLWRVMQCQGEMWTPGEGELNSFQRRPGRSKEWWLPLMRNESGERRRRDCSGAVHWCEIKGAVQSEMVCEAGTCRHVRQPRGCCCGGGGGGAMSLSLKGGGQCCVWPAVIATAATFLPPSLGAPASPLL